jgi:thiamine-phosphate diphosphorylase
VILIVTDRRRRDIVDQAAEAAAAGIDFLQIRERDLEAGALAAVTAAAVRVTRGSPTRVLVNDRLDVAIAAGADGVHLRADSIAAEAVRALAPRPFLVSRSVHSVNDARAAGPDVDFLVAGTVFPTRSKGPAHRLLGLDGLRAICAAVSVPVLAIGGVGEDRLDAIRAAGAAGVAGIGWFDGAVPFEQIVRAAQSRFDSTRRASYH